MNTYNHENLRLLGKVRRLKTDLDELEHQLLTALGVRKPKPVYERAAEWLLAVLIEKPVRRVVDKTFDRLERWREHRKSVGF